MGEGIGNDKALMPYIHFANIACGYHAGDEQTMWQTVELAVNNQVLVGAHVSFLDKKNFGRTEIDLPAHDIYELVQQQLILLNEIAGSFDVTIHHVKPHGALYNMSAKVPAIAKVIAEAVKDYDECLVLFGLSGSCSIKEAKSIGLNTASEVFADRTYQDDGSLTPRTQQGALIEKTEDAIAQSLRMLNEGLVKTVSGKTIPVVAETICIHGDGAHAVEFAKAIYEATSLQ